MRTLTEFLLARIAEDEAAALGTVTKTWDELAFHDQADADAPHIARHSPARALAECEVKRQLLELHESSNDARGVGCLVAGKEWSEYCEEDHEEWPCLHAKILALPFAEHPDYREEWNL